MDANGRESRVCNVLKIFSSICVNLSNLWLKLSYIGSLGVSGSNGLGFAAAWKDGFPWAAESESIVDIREGVIKIS